MNSYIHPGYHKPRWEAVNFQLPETSALSSHSPPCPQEATMVTADQLHEYVPVTLTQASTVHDHIHVDLFNKCLSCLWSAGAGPAAGVDLQAILYRRPGHSQGSYPRASWNPSLQILTDKVLWETNAICGFLTVRGWGSGAPLTSVLLRGQCTSVFEIHPLVCISSSFSLLLCSIPLGSFIHFFRWWTIGPLPSWASL